MTGKIEFTCAACGFYFAVAPEVAQFCPNCRTQLSSGTQRSQLRSVGAEQQRVQYPLYRRLFKLVAIVTLGAVCLIVSLDYIPRAVKPAYRLKQEHEYAEHETGHTTGSVPIDSQRDSGIGAPVNPGAVPGATSRGPTSEGIDRPTTLAVTVRAYDLIKDPFTYKGKIVRLEHRDFPRFWNGQLVDSWPYQGGPVSGLGSRTGLQFNRMLSADHALYDVMGMQMYSGSAVADGMSPVGQIILLLRSPSSRRPSPEQLWKVEPLGTTEGTNAFGAVLSVPLIRFWGYEGGSPECAAIARDALYAESSVKGDYRSALSQINSWVSCDPGSPNALSFRAEAFIQLQQFDKALEDVTRAIQLGPASGLLAADLNYLRGIAYAGLGKLVQARVELETAIRSGGAGKEAYQALADVCDRLGDTRAAMAARQMSANSGNPNRTVLDDPTRVHRVAEGISAPNLIQRVEPAYSKEAQDAKLQGTVELYIEVEADGSVGKIEVRKGLGMGLDEKAIAAVRQWKFRPGLKDGRPVRTAAIASLHFRLL